MYEELSIRKGTPDDIDTIGRLAREIWPVAYGTLLTKEQLNYMLDLFYSGASLEKQMQTDGHSFIIAELDKVDVGFAAYSPIGNPNMYKLHKLYVLPGLQGKGVGKVLLNHIINKLTESNAIALRLNVNRHNTARHFYNKLGFEIVYEEVNDIGHGFVMDDYVMEKKLS
jgi:GNAT superfamily N-acetyltransferase